jgi:hypothetical protein
VENPYLEDEPYITFNYSCIIEDLLGTYIELSSKVYNNLFNLRYYILFTTDLKYVYLIIPLYLDNRYYFTFIISSIS